MSASVVICIRTTGGGVATAGRAEFATADGFRAALEAERDVGLVWSLVVDPSPEGGHSKLHLQQEECQARTQAFRSVIWHLALKLVSDLALRAIGTDESTRH